MIRSIAAARKPPSLSDIYRMMGQSGKEKMQLYRFLSQALPVLGTAFLMLAACGANQPRTYAGDLTPVAGTCDPPGRAVLIKRGRYVEFTPRQGVLVLNGQVDAAGHVTASTQIPGADRKPYALKLDGALSGPAITGTYVTPRCRYAFALSESP